MSPAIVVLGTSGLETARRVADAIPGAKLHGFSDRIDTEITFSDTGEHLRALFSAGTPIIGICAAGVLIRCLAPSLADKTSEPPVLAIAEDGSAVVPLLGGHHGANALAETIAEALGAHAAVTTASDVRFGTAFDDPPPGWRLANPEHVKPFTAALLAGSGVTIEGDAPWLGALPSGDGLRILVTDQAIAGDETTLVYHPQTYALGLGCERGAADTISLAREVLAAADIAPGAVACIASLDIKSDEPALAALAAELGVPLRVFPATRLEQETPRLSDPSETVFREVGCHGVAEGATLACVGEDGALVVTKRKRDGVTCALARAAAPLDASTIGAARGRLAVIGIGPGAAEWRTPEASRLVAESTNLVGYGLYLDLLGNVKGERHAYALGEEEKRVDAALDLAGEGRQVALICSGDAGIYAMASLVFERLERCAKPQWRPVEVVVAPGISALQAAAARAGAPLGHDFCAISLSDLMTPWEIIERRITAAAEGDFVIAFYNPVSKRRRQGLVEARRILLEHRADDTPVLLARSLGRADESVTPTTLGRLSVDDVDMMTLVMVGASGTRTLGRDFATPWVYTPRGYGDRA
jgi:cobalt-precorrin 5A hydrolase / precorrin-3B C17-methyltransferase